MVRCQDVLYFLYIGVIVITVIIEY